MEWVQLLVSLTGVLGLIFFLFYLMRKLNRRGTIGGGLRGGNKLRVLDRAGVGRESALLVVCVAGKLMVVGVSQGGINKICDLPLTEEEYLAHTGLPAGQAGNFTGGFATFRDVLNNLRSGGKSTKQHGEKQVESAVNNNAENSENENKSTEYGKAGGDDGSGSAE